MEKNTLLGKFKESIGEPNAATQMYENIGISARTLDAYVDTILPGVGEDSSVTEEFMKGHLGILKAMGGQLRHEMAEFVKSKKTDTPPTDPKPMENEELKLVKQQIEELAKALKDERAKKDIESLRKLTRDKSRELQVQNKALWDDVVNSIDIPEDTNESALVDSVKVAYESKLKAYFGNGAEPYGGNNGRGTGDDKAAKEELDDFFAQKAKEGKFPSVVKH